MSYAYLFKYIIIGDTGESSVGRLLFETCIFNSAVWGAGAIICARLVCSLIINETERHSSSVLALSRERVVVLLQPAGWNMDQ